MLKTTWEAPTSVAVRILAYDPQASTAYQHDAAGNMNAGPGNTYTSLAGRFL
jgi:hypothetical protein